MVLIFQICENNWQEVWDDDQKVPYAFSGDTWVGYDNVDSFKIKVRYL